MQNSISSQCPLCNNSGKVFYKFKNRLYNQCSNCKGIFVDENLWLDLTDEKNRYQKHENDTDDLRYQNFVSPITKAVLADFSPKHKGLDFGAGTAPVISKLLSDKNFSVVQYDPFFHNQPKLLKNKYDYIVCCEVIEHFYHPAKEFNLLKSLLNPGGKLYCMTHLWEESINFHTWYYKNDLTHVFIYTRETIYWIQKKFQFPNVSIDNRLIVFSN